MNKTMMDERFMLNKVPVGDVLDTIGKAEVVEFTTMQATESRRKYGVTAQSISDLKCAVERDGLGNYYVDGEALIPVLIKAVQELSARVDSFATFTPAEGEIKGVLTEEPEPVKKPRNRKPKAEAQE